MGDIFRGAKGLKTMVLVILISLICVNGRGFGHGGNGRYLGDGDDGRGYKGHGDNGKGHGPPGNAGGLSRSFYKQSCSYANPRGGVEGIVRSIVQKHMKNDFTIAAALLRMQFHDCFLRGCDASVLIQSNDSNQAEREGPANRNLRGFDVIDDVKQEMQEVCPGVVSCADILALATRDAVEMLPEGGTTWEVQTGRRDGLVSLASEVRQNIPSPSANFSQLKTLFESKGFSVEELVILSGAHTIGVGHCGAFSKRLYNFSGQGDTDPSLNKDYAIELKASCKPGDSTTAVPMDPGSEKSFDEDYFNILKQNKGLFSSDAALLTEASLIVDNESRGKVFIRDFAKAMKKLVELEVMTGSDGEIRKKCGFVN